MRIFFSSALSILLACAVHAAAAGAPAEPLTRSAPQPLAVESIGTASARAWYRVLPPGRSNDQSPWKQLIWFTRATQGRAGRQSHFAVANFASGEVKDLPTIIPCYEPWCDQWVQGKLYIGTNLPPRLAVYDPADDSLKDLGDAFGEGRKTLTLFRMAVGPDGALALGGGSGTDLSVFDPKNNSFTRYGTLGPVGSGYLYSLSMDEKYVYCAVRSTLPWQLVRVNRQTKEVKVLGSCPVEGWMEVEGNKVSLNSKVGGKDPQRCHLVNGEMLAVPPDAAALAGSAGWTVPGPGFAGSAADVQIDESPLVSKDPKLVVYMQNPADQQWRKAELAVGLHEDAPLTRVVALADGRVAGISAGYLPMVVTDPTSNQSVLSPTPTSCYGLLALDHRVFTTGYPSCSLNVYDAEKPLTWTQTLPDRPGVPMDSEKANPRRIHYFAGDTNGAHVGLFPTGPMADGKVYLVARRHRYFYNFALACFDPSDYQTGVFDDGGAFNHFQIGWMSAIDNGKKLAISTYVEPNPQVPGKPSDTAALFIFDVTQRKIVAKLEPVKSSKVLTGVVETGPDQLVGVASDPDGTTSTLYRVNLRTGSVEQRRTYAARFCGEPSELGVPAKTQDFQRGPDGKVWATVSIGGDVTLLVRIDPKDLSIDAVGTVNGRLVQLCFDRGRVYLSGATTVRRLKDIHYETAAH